MSDKDELERQNFERWLDENSYNKQRDQMGLYESSFCQIAWIGWLARSKQQLNIICTALNKC